MNANVSAVMHCQTCWIVLLWCALVCRAFILTLPAGPILRKLKLQDGRVFFPPPPQTQEEMSHLTDRTNNLLRQQSIFFLRESKSFHFLGALDLILIDKLYPLSGVWEYPSVSGSYVPDRDTAWKVALYCHRKLSTVFRIPFLDEFCTKHCEDCVDNQYIKEMTLLPETAQSIYSDPTIVKQAVHSNDDVVHIPCNILTSAQVIP